jgi:uncharacterized Zn-binding protein involved in type VI secretion
MDTSTHDTITPAGAIGPPISGPCPGLGQVMIEGQPAAHVGCVVGCTGALAVGVAHPPPPVPPLILVGAATVFIHGKPAARWAPAPDLTACGSFLGNTALAGSRTVFIGDVSSTTLAITNLKAMLDVKLTELDRWDAPPQAKFQKWFGKTDASAKATIKVRIEKIQTLLKTYSDANFQGAGKENDNSTFAMVDPVDDQIVYLANGFTNSPMTGADSAPGVLAHEMSHFKTIGATNDVEDAHGIKYYGTERSAELARQDPSLALKNADNFEYFIEDGQ